MRVILPIIFIFITNLNAEYSDSLSNPLTPRNIISEYISIGVGYGLDYGGIGGKVTLFLSDRLGFFIGYGNNIIGTSYNLGPVFRFNSGRDRSWIPYIIVMFGNNSVVEFTNDDEKSRFFDGTTLGLGITRKSPRSRHIFESSLNLIVRDSRADTFVKDQRDLGEDINYINNWFGASIGYKFVLF